MKLLSEQMQCVLALSDEGKGGPAIIAGVRHVFLQKKKQQQQQQQQSNNANAFSSPSQQHQLDNDLDRIIVNAFGVTVGFLANHCRAKTMTPRQHEQQQQQRALSRREPRSSSSAAAAASAAVVPAEHGSFFFLPRPLETLTSADRFLQPCSLSVTVKGRLTNDRTCDALLELLVDSLDDEVSE